MLGDSLGDYYGLNVLKDASEDTLGNPAEFCCIIVSQLYQSQVISVVPGGTVQLLSSNLQLVTIYLMIWSDVHFLRLR